MIIENLLNNDLTCEAIWNAYQEGVSYNEQKQIVDTVEENRNMFIGRQWEDVNAEGLPTIVLDFIKPTVHFKVASIVSTRTKITAQTVGLAGMTEKEQKHIAGIVNKQLDQILEREQSDGLLLLLETNTAIDGDGCWNIYWDDKIKTGQVMDPKLDGDIAIENIQNVNVYFGNPCSNEVQDQPYIIIERREYITTLKAYAKKQGLDEIDIASIQPDKDNQYTITTDDNRVTVLTMYWRDYETDTIKMAECTQNIMLQEPQDTGLEFYPVCWQNWEPRLNDYHGEPCVSEMVSNQKTVNILAGMNTISLSRTAFPTIVYNSEMLPEGWDNSVGAAIGVSNKLDLKASDVAQVIEGAVTNSQVEGFYNNLLQTSKDLNGASDAMMGNIDPSNTSAIIALQKTALVPLELNRRRLYSFLEDFARIAIDFMGNYYGTRLVMVDDPETDQEVRQEFDFSILKDAAFNIKIDVGASSYWSELTELQQLEKLVQMRIIGGLDYLEYMPDGLFAGRQELLDKLKKAQVQQQFEGQQAALQSMLAKSPELAAQLKQLKETNPQGYDQAIQSLYQKIQQG